MEIVIKISEERFSDIQRISEVQLECNHFKTAEQIIAKGTPLPTAQKQGQWVQIYIPLPLSDSGKDCYCCSECRTHWDYTSNYCPNCGAKMISTSKDVK